MIKRLFLPASFYLVAIVACHNTPRALPMPEGVRFVPRAAWGAHAPVLPMTQHDVPYHYYVAVDGAVAEGREWRYVGDTNTEYNPAGHLLVVVEGNFETDTLTSAQRRTLDALIPALARDFHIAGSMVGGHRDFANTRCPGRHLYAEIPRLRALIADGR